MISHIRVQIAQSNNSYQCCHPCNWLPYFVSFFIFMRIMWIIPSLTFVSLIISFLGLYLIEVLFEQFVRKIEFIVDQIFSLIGLIVFVNHLVIDVFVLGFKAGWSMLVLMLKTFIRIWKYFISLLNMSKELSCIRLFGEIRMILFDKLQIRWFQLLLGESGG